MSQPSLLNVILIQPSSHQRFRCLDLRVSPPHLSTQCPNLNPNGLQIRVNVQCPPQSHQRPGIIPKFDPTSCQSLPSRIVEAAVPKTDAINALGLKVISHTVPANCQLVLSLGKSGNKRNQILRKAERILIIATIIQMHHSKQMLMVYRGTIAE